MWFDPIAESLNGRLDNTIKRLEFIVGIRVNGNPHIGTYLTLASTFVFAEQARERFTLPASVHIHFLDNDPVLSDPDANQSSAYFHCVFQQQSESESLEFLNLHYFPYLDRLATLSGCSYTSETYSSSQLKPFFRSTVLKSLHQWQNFKYYVSGLPFVGSPTGVRGIGSPCPKCGKFDGWMRPHIDLDRDSNAILTSTCPNHSQHSTRLTPSNDTFINLETAFRNVIKEIMALNTPEVLAVMIKGQDWHEGLQNVNTVMEILGIEKGNIPLRFLLPVVKNKSGYKLSKSAIQKFSRDFVDVNPTFLDMTLFRQQFKDYPEAMLNLSKQILSEPQSSIDVNDLSLRLRG